MGTIGSLEKSPASPLFNQPFIRAQIKAYIKPLHHWPLCGEFTGDLWKDWTAFDFITGIWGVTAHQGYDWTNLVSIDFSMAFDINLGIMTMEICGARKCPPTKLNKLEIGPWGPVHIPIFCETYHKDIRANKKWRQIWLRTKYGLRYQQFTIKKFTTLSLRFLGVFLICREFYYFWRWFFQTQMIPMYIAEISYGKEGSHNSDIDW